MHAHVPAPSFLHVQETFDFRRNLRKKDALDIDLSTNKEVLAEVSKFKESGGAALLTAGWVGSGGQR